MTQQTNARETELVLGSGEHPTSGVFGTVVADTYRVTGLIGAGGSSDVFRVEHLRLGKPFALKLLRADASGHPQAAKRFRREARAIASLESEHIVSIVDSGELTDGRPFLVMELLQGKDLRSLLRQEGHLPCRRALHILLDAARGLTAVHAAGLIHRDLKPENLFVTRRAGGEDCCKILDFGVAKLNTTIATVEGSLLGTVRYMAPEQLQDSSKAGPESDVYALGAIAYECLTGAPAHAGDTVQELMFSVINKTPRSLRDVRPELPENVSTLVMRCLQKNATARYASAAELVEALTTALSLATPVSGDLTVTDRAWTPTPVRGRSRLLRVLPWLISLGLAALALAQAKGPAIQPARAARPTPVAAATPAPRPIPTEPVVAVPAPTPGPSQRLEAEPSPVSDAARPKSSGKPRRQQTAPAPAPTPAKPKASTPPDAAASLLDPTNPYEN